jgi:formate--tetrahydrofolate ligase
MPPAPPLRPIQDVAADLGFDAAHVTPYGAHRAKISLDALPASPSHPGTTASRAEHVLVTAVTPTKSGEGKTVTSIGLAMGLARLGARAVVTLRQSSLGPTFGGKGGGAGGGAATLVPLEETILGLADDLFAVETANNLLASVVDDYVFRGAAPKIAPDAVTWRRVLDVNDRSLRHVTTRLDGRADGPTRESAFDITPASEVMAILMLSRDRADLRRRLGNIVVGFTADGAPLTAESMQVAGAMAALLQRAFSPNLVQTSEGTPAIVHTGPFANIAPGNSSVVGDLVASTRADYVITEAGFATELGAEKYFHLKLPATGLQPSAAVLVATVRAAREHDPSGATLDPGLANLRAHVANLRAFGVPVVVAVNRFPDDAPDDLKALREAAMAAGAADCVEHTAFADGGRGCEALAAAVKRACRGPAAITPLVDASMSPETQVESLATTLYGAARVEWSESARLSLARFRAAGFTALPVCMAKTNRSLSHDAKLLGAPKGFTFPVRDVRLAAGAGYFTVLAGDIMTMPGLPRTARYRHIDVDPDGTIRGLA